MESTSFPLFLLAAEIVFNRLLFPNVSTSGKSAPGNYRAGCLARLPHPGRDRGGRRSVPSRMPRARSPAAASRASGSRLSPGPGLGVDVAHIRRRATVHLAEGPRIGRPPRSATASISADSARASPCSGPPARDHDRNLDGTRCGMLLTQRARHRTREGRSVVTLLWILAVILVISGIVAILRKQLLWGAVLIVVGLLVGPGGVSIFT